MAGQQASAGNAGLGLKAAEPAGGQGFWMDAADLSGGRSAGLADQLAAFNAGTCRNAWQLFGSRPAADPQGREGYFFRVWAPHAARVGVVGSFNGWLPAPLDRVAEGVWQGFVPGCHLGQLYQYYITTADGRQLYKSDPFALHGQADDGHASILYRLDNYPWQQPLPAQPAPHDRLPMNIYEVHLGSWRRYADGNPFSYHKLAGELVTYAVRMGYTHLQLLPVMEHPFGGSWGYQVSGYFAATSRYGTPDGLMALIDAAHAAGLGVILDWVPAHFPRDGFGLVEFDGQPLYEYPPQAMLDLPAWGTLRFDYGRPQVRSFLISSALFWLTQYHADGLRVDAVSAMLYLDYDKQPGQWRPNPDGSNHNPDAVGLLQQLNTAVHDVCPYAVTIAEESTTWWGVTRPAEQGGLGFDYKWNLGFMNDTQTYIRQPPDQRPQHHAALTFPLTYQFAERFLLPLSHDEVVHGKKSLLDRMPGSYDDKFANLRCYYAYFLAMPGKKLHFMGAEIGQFAEWNPARELDWLLLQWQPHRQLQQAFAQCNRLYRALPALWQQDDGWHGYNWITCDDAAASIIAFYRRDTHGRLVVCVCNFSAVCHTVYPLGLPRAGRWVEILNTDARPFGGLGRCNPGRLQAVRLPMHGRPYRLTLLLPPLSTLYLRPCRPVLPLRAAPARRPAQPRPKEARHAAR